MNALKLKEAFQSEFWMQISDAVASKDLGLVIDLIDDVRPSKPKKDATMPMQLFAAIQENDFYAVKRLIENGADLNVINLRGWSALSCALYRGHKQIALLLQVNGAKQTRHLSK